LRAHPLFVGDLAALRAALEEPRSADGVSTGDFEEALLALLGKDASGLSASTISRLKEAWSDEHTRWSKRDLSAKRYVYFWVDGIHVQARLEHDAQCLLVIIGATPEGKKELVGLIDGVRESSQSWKELLLDEAAWACDGA
jgi:transposase-like protein